MLAFLIYFFMGLSLSIDAFSISLSLGTLNLSNNKVLLISIIIGILHFIFPNIGYQIGLFLNERLIINNNIISSIIFFFLAYEIYNNKRNNSITIGTITSLLLIPISVSIDSLTIGIAFGLNHNNILLASIIFSLTTFIITIIGFYLGIRLYYTNQNKAINLGILIMLILALKSLFNI